MSGAFGSATVEVSGAVSKAITVGSVRHMGSSENIGPELARRRHSNATAFSRFNSASMSVPS